MDSKGKNLVSLFTLAAAVLVGGCASLHAQNPALTPQAPADQSGSQIIIVSPDVKDLACPSAAQVAEKYRKEGYTGVASAYTEDGRAFYVLTGKDGKNWAHLYEEQPGSGTICTAGEGADMQTAQPTGRLMFASATPSGNGTPNVVLAAFRPNLQRVSSNDLPLDEQGCAETGKVLSYLNGQFAESVVFKGTTENGTIVRMTATTDKDGAGWTLVSSFPDDSISCLKNAGDNFRFVSTFTPPHAALK